VPRGWRRDGRNSNGCPTGGAGARSPPFGRLGRVNSNSIPYMYTSPFPSCCNYMLRVRIHPSEPSGTPRASPRGASPTGARIHGPPVQRGRCASRGATRANLGPAVHGRARAQVRRRCNREPNRSGRITERTGQGANPADLRPVKNGRFLAWPSPRKSGAWRLVF
jgi:hypothetical protein